MSKLNFNTSDRTLDEILGNGKSYQIPLYQRDYSWKEDNWIELWEDIVDLVENKSDHYMGTIVLKENNKKDFEIVDGQQRLTSLNLFILAAVNIIKEFDQERAETLKNTYLCKRKIGSNQYVPKLELNKNNRGFYITYLINSKDIAQKVSGQTTSNKLILASYHYFHKSLKIHFESKKYDVDKIDKFLNDVANNLIFIQIGCDSDDKVYSIFETLNARGVNLDIVDLIKNYVYGTFAKANGGEVSIIEDFWVQIIEKLDNKGLLALLKDYFTCYDNKVVREKEIFKKFKTKYKTTESIQELMEEILKIADFYTALDNPDDEYWSDKRSDKKFIKSLNELNLFGVNQYKSIALATKIKIPNELDSIVSVVKNITFRYNIVAGKVANEIERVYASISQNIINGEIVSVNQVKDMLQNVYIPDQEFISSFSNLTKKYRSNKVLINYILNQINAHISGVSVFELTDTSATIEHILPKSFAESYNIAEKEWPMFTDRVGNYTLLEAKLNNQEAANHNFEIKKTVYKKSSFKITQKLSEYSEWNKSTIQNYQEYLAKQACAIWKI